MTVLGNHVTDKIVIGQRQSIKGSEQQKRLLGTWIRADRTVHNIVCLSEAHTTSHRIRITASASCVWDVHRENPRQYAYQLRQLSLCRDSKPFRQAPERPPTGHLRFYI